MAFFNSAIGVLQTLVIALGAGLAVWGGVNLMEGYGQDNPGAKSQGMKQLMAGGGIILIGVTLVPLLAGLFPS
ncbi:MAG: Maff2 family protein [Lachnospiraceae bacterium]|nr:Maff2 family protein [Lachnospiraceae bacterium]